VEKLQREKDPKKRQRMVEDSQKTTGPTMIFATVDYPGCCEDKSGTEEIAKRCAAACARGLARRRESGRLCLRRWNALLGSKGMDAQAYVVDNATILFSTNHGLFADEVAPPRPPVLALAQPTASPPPLLRLSSLRSSSRSVSPPTGTASARAVGRACPAACPLADSAPCPRRRTPGPAETPEWKAKDEVRKAAKAKADAEAKAAKEAAEKAAKRAKRRRRRKKREAKQKDEV